MNLKKIVFNFPGKTILESYQDMFSLAYFNFDMGAYDLCDYIPTHDDLDTAILVQNMATMLCLTSEKFVIFEDNTYHVGTAYYDNASSRLELENYCYIYIDVEV